MVLYLFQTNDLKVKGIGIQDLQGVAGLILFIQILALLRVVDVLFMTMYLTKKKSLWYLQSNVCTVHMCENLFPKHFCKLVMESVCDLRTCFTVNISAFNFPMYSYFMFIPSHPPASTPLYLAIVE